MTSWLRVLGVRVASLCALASIVLVAPHASARPDLPLALLDSFDQAFSLVYDAAERRVAELEATRPPSPLRPDLSALLDQFAGQVAIACDAAATALDVELAISGSLSTERRHAALGCLERHLRDARRAAAGTADPTVRAEYEVTCERLRDVRRLI